jgi:hypothetical protein
MSSSVDSPPEAEVGAPKSQSGLNPSRRLRLSAGLVLVSLFLGIAVLMVLHYRVPKNTGIMHAVLTPTSDFQLLRLKGTTAAMEARAIEVPLLAGQQIGTPTITHLIPSGTRVKRGEVFAEFDRQEQERDIIDKRSHV